MVAYFLAGVHLTLGLCFVLLSGFFLQAWIHRRAEGEYVLFAGATLAMGIYSSCGTPLYVAITQHAEQQLHIAADASASVGGVAMALVLAFSIRYARRDRHRAVEWGGYAIATAMAIAAGSSRWRSGPIEVLSDGEHSLPLFSVPLSAAGITLASALLVVQALAAGYLLYAYVRLRRESLATLLGAIALMLASIHDVMALGLHWFDSIGTVPFAFMLVSYGVAVTVVRRYGRLAKALEKRKAELRQRSDELARSLEQLRLAQEELVHSEQLAVVGEFAAVITHEVRNPMAIVNNAVTSLRRAEALTDDTRTLLGIIESEMSRLERLVTHLLNYARPLAPQRQPLELRPFLEGLLDEVGHVYPDLDVSLDCKGTWPTVYVDADMLASALANILTNAVQAMDARGELRVRVARRRIEDVACVVIGFEDTGEGMTEHQLEQAVSPFYTTRPSGTGLGLPNSERIIDAHGGALVISSEHGVGTAVSVILPEKPDERLGPAASRRSLPPPTAGVSRS
jgi:signal transduction histidine kinase